MRPKMVILVVLGLAVAVAITVGIRKEAAPVPAAPPARAEAVPPPAAVPSAEETLPPAAPAVDAVPRKTQGAPVPAYHASAAAARPLPATLSPELFAALPVVARAYRIAKRIPDVLAQQPCYCRCDRMGHVGLLDCYRSDHGAG